MAVSLCVGVYAGVSAVRGNQVAAKRLCHSVQGTKLSEGCV